ncbi:MAG: 2OG-Fe(II) oxygenase [Rhodospirillales bacterium]
MSEPIIADEFCPFAAELRAAFDAHFADPYAMNMQAHGVWNYWYVPGKYTYLRSAPSRVLGDDLAQRFLASLRDWALRHTGLVPVSPLLSLYVVGCHQALHNDAANGRLGFVYSLTNWRERKFDGGETLLLKQGEATGPAGRTELFDLIEPLFNRLLLFDDCRPHGVATVAGPMDPRQGRVVLHGHLVEQGVQVLEGKPDPALR